MRSVHWRQAVRNRRFAHNAHYRHHLHPRARACETALAHAQALPPRPPLCFAMGRSHAFVRSLRFFGFALRGGSEWLRRGRGGGRWWSFCCQKVEDGVARSPEASCPLSRRFTSGQLTGSIAGARRLRPSSVRSARFLWTLAKRSGAATLLGPGIVESFAPREKPGQSPLSDRVPFVGK